ncbi:MAG TPA: FAD-dependent oxidoreductase, partial [Armatimonadota bacterium]
MLDVIIIGGGPAGMTAAIYAARKRLDSMIIAPEIGGQAAWALQVENYLGFKVIDGVDLAEKFQEHVKKFNVPVEYDNVSSVEIKGNIFLVKTEAGKEFEGKTVIVATGRSARNLNVPGEKEFKSKGVAYCATCDAPLFADLDVAVVGSGNAGLTAAVSLIKIAKKLYVIESNPDITGDNQFRSIIAEAPNAQIMLNTRVLEIIGEKMVTGIKIRDLTTKEERTIPLEGVFIEVGSSPNTRFLPPEVKKNDRGEVVIDCSNHTSVP